MSRRALITGITGQDGAYLARLLLERGYEVHGMVRRSSSDRCERIAEIRDRLHLHPGDLIDQSALTRILAKCQPQEVYNLAAQTYVGASFSQPTMTAEFTALGVTRMLEAVRQVDPSIRFLQASSSEVFGGTQEDPQNEKTPFWPRSPYAVAKVYAYWITVNYRESYGLFASNAIMFNHESPWRGSEFVTRRISQGVAKIKLGLADCLELGNLDAQRDWGFAGDFVDAMWRILQADTPDDFVIATGVRHSVRAFAERAFARVGLDWEKYVRVDPARLRPVDVPSLRGDASKAQRVLGWRPTVTFEPLVDMMVDADLAALSREHSLSHREQSP